MENVFSRHEIRADKAYNCTEYFIFADLVSKERNKVGIIMCLGLQNSSTVTVKSSSLRTIIHGLMYRISEFERI